LPILIRKHQQAAKIATPASAVVYPAAELAAPIAYKVEAETAYPLVDGAVYEAVDPVEKAVDPSASLVRVAPVYSVSNSVSDAIDSVGSLQAYPSF
jgi:hypothetical protein